jgi:hypothetical protein
MLEAQLLMGGGQAQVYRMGSFSYRADFPLDDIMASIYGGVDVHDATSPVAGPDGGAIDSSSAWYFGVHAGGTLWWEITNSFYFRTDMQVNYSPGTILLILFSLDYRFGGSGGGG